MSSLTLKKLREESGMSIRQIVEKMKAAEPDVPQFRSGLIHLENRGTSDLPTLRALAAAYGKPLDVVEAAAAASRNNYRKSKNLLPKGTQTA